MGQLRLRTRRAKSGFGEIFLGELTRSLARGLTVITGAGVLEILHRLLA